MGDEWFEDDVKRSAGEEWSEDDVKRSADDMSGMLSFEVSIYL